MNLTELKALTKDQLIAELLEGQTEEKADTEYFPDGQMKRQVRRLFDAYGNLLSERVASWSYYKEGPVDTITLAEGGKVKTIKHAKTGGIAKVMDGI